MLGHIEVVDDGGDWSAPLGGVKQRAVLATLLLDAGRPVATNRLIESVWEAPPASAAHAVEVYMSKLRKALAACGNGCDRIAHRNGGYVAVVEAEELDLFRFRSLTRQAATASSSGDPATASRILDAALALWRGEPLACVEGTPVAEHVCRELREERLAAVEARLDAELALGRHSELVAELRRVVAAHPDREYLWCRLMLALYRAGRQTEALETYLQARRRLMEQLGLEPGRELRDLQRRILEQDASLDLTASLAAADSRRPPKRPEGLSSLAAHRAGLTAAVTCLLSEPTTSFLGPAFSCVGAIV